MGGFHSPVMSVLRRLHHSVLRMFNNVVYIVLVYMRDMYIIMYKTHILAWGFCRSNVYTV